MNDPLTQIADTAAADDLNPDPSYTNFQFYDEDVEARFDLQEAERAKIHAENEAASRPYPRFIVESERVTASGRTVQEGRYQDDPGTESNPNHKFIPDKTEWQDPQIEAYHKRIEARRYEIWMQNWYRRNQPDKRENLIANLISAELSPHSFLSKLKNGLAEEGVESQTIHKIWEKMSIYKIVKDLLKKPEVQDDSNGQPRTKKVRRKRILKGEEITYYSKQEVEAEKPAELAEWLMIHQALNGHGSMDFLPRPARKTLFLNPDGSRFLNTSAKIKGPIQAKMAFAKLHKTDPQRVMVERTVYQKGSQLLRQLNLPDKQTSIYVISLRKLSNEAASSYYDPDPSFSERRGIDDEWEQAYQWTSGALVKIENPNGNNILPHGSHVLSVRDLERAVLAGAVFAEDEADRQAMDYLNTEESGDDRVRTPDNVPRKDIRRMTEDEGFLYQTLLQCGYYEIAEMMTTDFNALQDMGQDYVSQEIAATIYNEFRPGDNNPKWIELSDTIFVNQLQSKRNLKGQKALIAAHTATRAILDELTKMLFSLSNLGFGETPASQEPGE